MPIDATIALGAKAPDTTQQLSSLLTVAKGAQDVQAGGISLNERKAVSQVLSDPSSYTDQEGNIDFTRAMPKIMQVAPTTGMKYVQDLMTAQKSHTEAQQSLNSLTTDVRAQAGKVLYGLPADAAPDVVHGTIDALQRQYKGGDAYWDTLKKGYDHAAAQGKAGDFLSNAAKTTLPQPEQQTMNTPAGVTLDNGQQTALVNLKPGVPGMPQGSLVQGTQVQKVLPPGQQEEITTDAFGNRFINRKDPHGDYVGTRPLQSATSAPGPVSFPPGESKETFDALNQERNAAKAVATAAPTMHDINRTIVREIGNGLTTGKMGEVVQKLRSVTGFKSDKVGDENATDYNIVGKMLERSALTAAQSMGPHTNAGLEAAVRANGSLEYTPQALKKIAYLNDALVSGSELYSQGLEKSIQGSPNNVFAKRDFDRQWGQVADPQVLRLKNAVDQGNKEEISSIVQEVGGKGTKGAHQLHEKLTKLIQLTGQ